MNRYFFGTLATLAALSNSQAVYAIDLGSSFAAEDQASTVHVSDYETDDSDEVTTNEPSDTEVIHERYPNRAVKVERHVIQDAAGNYLNHGTWTNWDENGKLIARGEYNHGNRDGKWMHWYGAKEAKLFNDSAAGGFQRPLGTEITFKNGQIDGIWKVFDAKKRTVCEWNFENGRRIGRSVWYLPNGAVWQEVNFKDGQMDGDLNKLGPDNKLVVKERYIDGRRHAIETKFYPGGKKQSEGWMLYPRTYDDATYDWWTGTAQTVPVPKDRKAQLHGHWTRWHANGQIKFDGAYEYDAPVGTITWWHSNGQTRLRGAYTSGSQDGTFTWWYPTGQKQVEGMYSIGVPTGKWMRWTAEGKVVQAENYQHENHADADAESDEADKLFGELPDSPTDAVQR
jgi:antitoxin component YwqK of YwqJK toxin-antitoxin module